MKPALLLLLVVSLASCAVPNARQGTSEEERLLGRVEEFWSMKKLKDWEGMKGIIDPEEGQESGRYIDDLRKRQGTSEILSYDVLEAVREDGKATVTGKVTVRLTHPLLGTPQTMEQTVKDQWVNRGGVWYLRLMRTDLRRILEEYGERGGEK